MEKYGLMNGREALDKLAKEDAAKEAEINRQRDAHAEVLFTVLHERNNC